MQTEQVDAGRAIDELKELAELTGGPDGARRVAWTAEWEKAREWFRGKLEEIEGITEIETDEAGNVWATAPGESERAVILGGHIDSVPNGGWLDGVLNVVGALEVMRALAPQERPVTLRLVDWADEEGARFGRSLFGSGAAARKRRRLPRVAHRAGSRSGEDGPSARGGIRHLRRRAPRRPLYGPASSLRIYTDGCEEGCLHSGGPFCDSLQRRRSGAGRRARHHGVRQCQPGDRYDVQRMVRDVPRPAGARSIRVGEHARRRAGGHGPHCHRGRRLH